MNITVEFLKQLFTLSAGQIMLWTGSLAFILVLTDGFGKFSVPEVLLVPGFIASLVLAGVGSTFLYIKAKRESKQ